MGGQDQASEFPAAMTRSAPAPLSVPPVIDPEPPAMVVSREVLGGKLMECDALLRRKFDTRDELCRLQESVESSLELLSRLQVLALEANVLEGVLLRLAATARDWRESACPTR